MIVSQSWVVRDLEVNICSLSVIKALSHHAVSCLWGDLSIWSETGGAGGGQ